MSYNHLLKTRFEGKPVIAEFPDPHRNRTVTAHYIGSAVDVGLTDGVDSWVAVAATAVKTPDLVKALQQHLSGESSGQAKARRKLLETDQPTTRKRIHVD